MFARKIAIYLLSKPCISNLRKEQHRNFQISIFGGAGEIGSNLTMLLKQNQKVSHIKLYDDEEKIKGYALELNQLPGGPKITAYSAGDIIPAVCDVDMIVITSKGLGPHVSALETNAVAVQTVCNAMAAYNPNAFLALSIDPINSLVPFAAALLYKLNAFNPFKLLGITNIDALRSKSLAGTVLQTNPSQLRIPVIGGHSDKTVIPLFSNMTPDSFKIDPRQADMLTSVVNKADNDIRNKKMGKESSTIASVWAINEFCQGIIDTLLYGHAVELHCFAANPHFGTRYFAGPNIIGPYGISQPPNNFGLSEIEALRLDAAIPRLNEDIRLGEELVTTFSTRIPVLPRTNAVHGLSAHIAATRRTVS